MGPSLHTLTGRFAQIEQLLPDWFYNPRFDLFGRQISLAGVTAFVGCILLALIISSVLQSAIIRRLLSRLGLDKRWMGLAMSTLGFAAFVALIFVGIRLAGIPIPVEAKIPGIGLTAIQIINLLVLVVLVIWLSSASKRFLFNRFLSRSGMDRALQFALAQIVGYIVLVTGILVAVQNVGINLSTLAVFAGALGVGLGLGLQDIASNFISGLVILAERPIKIGDRVEVDGVAGQVSSIRTRSTTVITNDNISMIVPNSKFIENTITNWSHGDPKVRFRIPVGVAYGTDTDLLRTLLIKIAREHPGSLADPEPTVFFDGFGESSLNFELVVWSEEMSYRPRRFRSDLNFSIERALREAGIEIPFPQRDIHIRDAALKIAQDGEGNASDR
jgi:small-conductance mechanosensitive channel